MRFVVPTLLPIAIGCVHVVPVRDVVPPGSERGERCLLERASKDFGCPIERITYAPCNCLGAVALDVCGVSALYGRESTSEGEDACALYLVNATFPRKRDDSPHESPENAP